MSRQAVEKGEIRAFCSFAASSVTACSAGGATFPKGEGTGDILSGFI